MTIQTAKSDILFQKHFAEMDYTSIFASSNRKDAMSGQLERLQ